jgi:hypothetical protein
VLLAVLALDVLVLADPLAGGGAVQLELLATALGRFL